MTYVLRSCVMTNLVKNETFPADIHTCTPWNEKKTMPC